MKFSCTQENLYRGLQVVSRIASKNVHLPILHNILLDAKDDGIELVATNLEIGARVRIRGKVERPGTFTLPGQVFANYISLIREDRVDLEQEGAEVIIATEKQRAKMKGDPANEFPLIPDVPQEQVIVLDTTVFKSALAQVLVGVSRDDTRPELTGVLFRIRDKQCILTTTDSYRLVERTIPVIETERENYVVIIPQAALHELVRILPDNERISLFFTENQALFSLKDTQITTRVIEGTFPDYEQIIPQTFRTTAIVKKEECIQAIKTSSIFSRSGIYDIHMHFSPENKEITLTTVNAQIGEHVMKIPADISGDSNHSIFNYQYVLDGLSSISSSDITIQLVDNVNPGVFRPQGEQEGSYMYIIMPIKQ